MIFFVQRDTKHFHTSQWSHIEFCAILIIYLDSLAYEYFSFNVVHMQYGIIGDLTWPMIFFLPSEKVCMLLCWLTFSHGVSVFCLKGSYPFFWWGCCVSVICLFSFPYLYYLNKLSQFIIAWCYHRVSAKSATNIWGYPPRTDNIFGWIFFFIQYAYQNELHSTII